MNATDQLIVAAAESGAHMALDSRAAGPAVSHAAHERRRFRAAVAEMLMARAPAAVAALDWDALDAAPAWLALPAGLLDALQSQVGAVLYGPAMRMWIDSGRLAAARAAVGDAFLRALLGRPDVPAAPRAPLAPAIPAAQVGAYLRHAGAAVLQATLPAALRGVAASALGQSAPMVIDAANALALVERALFLVECAGRDVQGGG